MGRARCVKPFGNELQNNNTFVFANKVCFHNTDDVYGTDFPQYNRNGTGA
jgi:hypothetical protein